MTKPVKDTLSPKQERFCQEYLLDLNATQAAIRSGYSPKTANEQGARLLANVKVSRRIEELKAERKQRVDLDSDYVLVRLQTIAERCLQEQPVTKGGKPVITTTPAGDLAAAYTFDAAGATRALELLGKHIGIFEKDNRQKSIPVEELIRQMDERDARMMEEHREERVRKVREEVQDIVSRNPRDGR